MTNNALEQAFKNIHEALSPEQLGAFNEFRQELYVEADRLRDKCRMTRGMHPADVDRLMDLICSIPVFEK